MTYLGRAKGEGREGEGGGKQREKEIKDVIADS